MFLISVLVPSAAAPGSRMLTFASTRRLPSSMLTSLTRAYSRICLSVLRYASASAALRMSGSLTISASGTPARLRSTAVAAGEPVVDRLPGVFLHVEARDADRPRRLVAAAGERHAAARRQRPVELRDLISFGQIGIEIVLAREDGDRVNRAVERERGANRQLDGVVVQDRQGPGQSEADGTGVPVRWRPEIGGAAAENLRLGLEVNVHLETDDHLVPRAAGRHRCASAPSDRSSA